MDHDPEIENFRKISGRVFQDLTIRVKGQGIQGLECFRVRVF